jgi:type I restriction enzyme M protein
LSELVKSDASIAKAHAAFLATLETWWQKNLSHVEALAPTDGKKGNVYELRRRLLDSISDVFTGQKLLTGHQVRGALARYFEFFKPEFKSIAFSGWGAELIPDDDILQSQFPEVLAEMEKNRLRLAERAALFAAADEEDYEDSDDTGVLPSDEVKRLKAELKEANAQAKLAKREKRDGTKFTAAAVEIEKRLARHKKLDDEARELKAALNATEKKQEELVAAARAKIGRDEARRVIIGRLHRILMQTYEGYQRAALAALENLHAKYAVTARVIETQRDAAARELTGTVKRKNKYYCIQYNCLCLYPVFRGILRECGVWKCRMPSPLCSDGTGKERLYPKRRWLKKLICIPPTLECWNDPCGIPA